MAARVMALQAKVRKSKRKRDAATSRRPLLPLAGEDVAGSATDEGKVERSETTSSLARLEGARGPALIRPFGPPSPASGRRLPPTTPVVPPHISHVRRVPLRAMGKLAHSGQASPYLEHDSLIWKQGAVVARSEATKQSRNSGDSWIASSPFGLLAMTNVDSNKMLRALAFTPSSCACGRRPPSTTPVSTSACMAFQARHLARHGEIGAFRAGLADLEHDSLIWKQGAVIARSEATKQSTSRRESLDCFVALRAPRNDERRSQ
jgi:hypothetical protein